MTEELYCPECGADEKALELDDKWGYYKCLECGKVFPTEDAIVEKDELDYCTHEKC